MICNPILEEAVSTFEHSTNGFGFAPNVAVWFTKWQPMQLTKWHLLMIFNPTLEDGIRDVISAIECSSGHGFTATNVYESDIMRGPNKPPKKDTAVLHQSSCTLHKSNVASSSNYGPLANDNCNSDSFHAAGSAVSQTSVPPTCQVGLLRNPNNFAGDECESDKLHGATMPTVHKTDHHNANLLQNDLVGSNNYHPTSDQTFSKLSLHTTYSRTATMHSACTSQPLKGTIPLIAKDRIMEAPALTQSKPQTAVEKSSTITTNSHDCYMKSSYPVLVGNTVRTYNTKVYASLPQQNKYMVKQRVRDASGNTKAKLVLQSSNER